MEKKSQNNYFYEENDINKIKQNYLKFKEDKSNSKLEYKYIDLNSSLLFVFIDRYKKLFEENYLKEIKEKLKSYDKEKNIEEIKKINEIINEAQLVAQKAIDDFDFYDTLILKTKNRYENWIITKDTYNKICEDVIDSIINNLIKNEKELIIIRDKIRNFEKKEKIIYLEKEIKQKEIKINQTNETINKVVEEKNDLTKINVDLRNKNSEQQKSYQNKINILEKQLKHLSDANSNFVQENHEVQTQLKDFQLYTNI